MFDRDYSLDKKVPEHGCGNCLGQEKISTDRSYFSSFEALKVYTIYGLLYFKFPLRIVFNLLGLELRIS